MQKLRSFTGCCDTGTYWPPADVIGAFHVLVPLKKFHLTEWRVIP
jgi:hypothetical protein